MSWIIQPTKLDGESKPYEWTFSLPAGVTISSAVCSASVYSGTDSAPNNIISGSASISGAVVTQKLIAGTAGVIYLVLCSATLSNSTTLQLQSYIAVVPS